MNSDIALHQHSMLEEVMYGLHKSPKEIPSKFFYDERGSELFEQITKQEEYYPTRTEKNILHENIDEISHLLGSDSVLVELGSGSSKKTRLLLDNLSGLAAYVPVEISERYLEKVVRELKHEYPKLLIKPLCADYTKPLTMPAINKPHTYYVLFYPGSTIGNFTPSQAQSFLQTLSKILNPGGGLLIGVDLKKDPKVLEAAYDDKNGVTADFNKNMLVRLNRELNADFDLNEFKHKARYSENMGRIEMHLVSQCKQNVHLGVETILFEKGESIHTENSYKYAVNEFEELVNEWFSVKKVWTDEDKLFSVQYLERN